MVSTGTSTELGAALRGADRRIRPSLNSDTLLGEGNQEAVLQATLSLAIFFLTWGSHSGYKFVRNESFSPTSFSADVKHSGVPGTHSSFCLG